MHLLFALIRPGASSWKPNCHRIASRPARSRTQKPVKRKSPHTSQQRIRTRCLLTAQRQTKIDRSTRPSPKTPISNPLRRPVNRKPISRNIRIPNRRTARLPLSQLQNPRQRQQTVRMLNLNCLRMLNSSRFPRHPRPLPASSPNRHPTDTAASDDVDFEPAESEDSTTLTAPVGPTIDDLKREQLAALEEDLKLVQAAQQHTAPERTEIQAKLEQVQDEINIGLRKLRQLTLPEPAELDEANQRLNALEVEKDKLQLELLNAKAKRVQDQRARQAKRIAREAELRLAIEHTKAELRDLTSEEAALGPDEEPESLLDLESQLDTLSIQVDDAQLQIKRRREAIKAATQHNDKVRQLKDLIAEGGTELARLEGVLTDLTVPDDADEDVSQLEDQLRRQADELEEVRAQLEEVEEQRTRHQADTGH